MSKQCREWLLLPFPLPLLPVYNCCEILQAWNGENKTTEIVLLLPIYSVVFCIAGNDWAEETEIEAAAGSDRIRFRISRELCMHACDAFTSDCCILYWAVNYDKYVVIQSPPDWLVLRYCCAIWRSHWHYSSVLWREAEPQTISVLSYDQRRFTIKVLPELLEHSTIITTYADIVNVLFASKARLSLLMWKLHYSTLL